MARGPSGSGRRSAADERRKPRGPPRAWEHPETGAKAGSNRDPNTRKIYSSPVASGHTKCHCSACFFCFSTETTGRKQVESLTKSEWSTSLPFDPPFILVSLDPPVGRARRGTNEATAAASERQSQDLRILVSRTPTAYLYSKFEFRFREHANFHTI